MSTSTDTPKMVFFSANANYGVIDYIHVNGRGLWTNKTKAELEASNGPLEELTQEQAIERMEAARTTSPKEITNEQFDYWLNCLPPSKWCRTRGAEVFHVSERITHSVVTWCVRLGKRFYTMDATACLVPDAVVEMVLAHVAKESQVVHG